MRAALLAHLGAQLEPVLGRRVDLTQARAVGGGCIHRAYCVGDGEFRCFVKVNDAGREDMFAAEADGLDALARAPLRVPRVLCCGAAAGSSFLVLEWLQLARGSARDYAGLGETLARMHACSDKHYGWRRDNYIGASHQTNGRSDDWCEFYGRARLAPQLALARACGHYALLDTGAQLIAALPRLLRGHAPQASLLHGDLWQGNVGFVADGTPLVFDPAVYCGDRETDLAMTELFGGFPEDFYAAYRMHAPLDPGYGLRKRLYMLYHVLNHANLFGGGYCAQAHTMMQRLLAEA